MTSTAAFKAYTPHRTPQKISVSTPSPLNRGQASKYPDADLWAAAHNQELVALDTKRVIQWTPDQELPRNTRLIPLTMGYRYSCDKNGQVSRRKARWATRGDTMTPHVRFNPKRTTTYMADKSSVRLPFAIAAAPSSTSNTLTSKLRTYTRASTTEGKCLSLYASTPVLTARSSMTAREENS